MSNSVLGLAVAVTVAVLVLCCRTSTAVTLMLPIRPSFANNYYPAAKSENLIAKKRFYSWEEGKRSSGNAVPRSLASYEDDEPWKRALYAWQSAKNAAPKFNDNSRDNLFDEHARQFLVRRRR